MAYSKYFSHSVDIFSNPMKEVGFQKGFDHVIRPQTVTDNAIEFKLDPDMINYLKVVRFSAMTPDSLMRLICRTKDIWRRYCHMGRMLEIAI